MSTATARNYGNEPVFDPVMIAADLEHYGLPARRTDVERVIDHFNALAAVGYELYDAPTTKHMEAMRALGLFDEFYSFELHKPYKLDVEPEVVDGVQRVTSMAVLRPHIAGVKHLVADQSFTGTIDAIYNAHKKTLKEHFKVSDPIEVVAYETLTLNPEAHTGAAVRVTVEFSNGMITQAVHTTTEHAAFLAFKAGFEMDMRARGMTPPVTGMQPR